MEDEFKKIKEIAEGHFKDEYKIAFLLRQIEHLIESRNDYKNKLDTKGELK